MFSKIALIASIFFSVATVQAASIPANNNVVCFGGFANSSVNSGTTLCIPTNDIKNYKFLTAAYGSGTTTSGNYYAFYDGATQYQVTAGRTLYVMGFYYITNLAAGTQKITFGSSTASFANNLASASPPAGYASYGGSGQFDHIFVNNSGASPMWFPYPMKFAAGTYPVWRSHAADQFSVIMIGKEIAN